MEIFKFDAIPQVYAILKRDMWGIYLLSVTSSFHLYKKNWANYSFSWKKKKKSFLFPKKITFEKMTAQIPCDKDAMTAILFPRASAKTYTE